VPEVWLVSDAEITYLASLPCSRHRTQSDGTVKIYWGGANTVMCVGEANGSAHSFECTSTGGEGWFKRKRRLVFRLSSDSAKTELHTDRLKRDLGVYLRGLSIPAHSSDLLS
jgi:hypothetical protein